MHGHDIHRYYAQANGAAGTISIRATPDACSTNSHRVLLIGRRLEYLRLLQRSSLQSGDAHCGKEETHATTAFQENGTLFTVSKATKSDAHFWQNQNMRTEVIGKSSRINDSEPDADHVSQSAVGFSVFVRPSQRLPHPTITTFSLGVPSDDPIFSIASTYSLPSITSPNTVCLPLR